MTGQRDGGDSQRERLDDGGDQAVVDMLIQQINEVTWLQLLQVTTLCPRSLQWLHSHGGHRSSGSSYVW
jgi:hypothetical protein